MLQGQRTHSISLRRSASSCFLSKRSKLAFSIVWLLDTASVMIALKFSCRLRRCWWVMMPDSPISATTSRSYAWALGHLHTCMLRMMSALILQ